MIVIFYALTGPYKKETIPMGQSPGEIGRTVSRFLFYLVIYLLDLPPGKERAALLSVRTFRYT